MKESYHIVDKKDKQKIEEYFLKNAQCLLPMVELIEGSRVVIDELIAVVGRASIEAVLTLSAQGIAGEKRKGKKGGEIHWHGSQKSTIKMSDRKLKVKKPRLRKKDQGKGGEVEIPAFSAINSSEQMGKRILDTLMCNVSTRDYGNVITEMAETVGVSKSNISREFVDASTKELEGLMNRRFFKAELNSQYILHSCLCSRLRRKLSVMKSGKGCLLTLFFPLSPDMKIIRNEFGGQKFEHNNIKRTQPFC